MTDRMVGFMRIKSIRSDRSDRISDRFVPVIKNNDKKYRVLCLEIFKILQFFRFD